MPGVSWRRRVPPQLEGPVRLRLSLQSLPQTLIKFREDGLEEAIVIVPHWPRRMWSPLLMKMATLLPNIFPVERDLLSQFLPDKGLLLQPDLETLQLSAGS